MTLTKYNGAYEELFQGCVWYSDGSLNSDGTLANLVNTSLNGTITGATKTGTDRFGITNKTIQFTGLANSRVDTGIIPNWTSGTIVFWMLNEQPNTDFHYIGCQSYVSGNYPHVYISRYSSLAFGFAIRNSSGTIISISSVSEVFTGNWQFIVLSWGSLLKGYFDGNLTLVSSPSTIYPAGLDVGFSFGVEYHKINGYEYPWAYKQGESWFFNTQLTDVQVKMLYNLTKNKYLCPILSGIRGVL